MQLRQGVTFLPLYVVCGRDNSKSYRDILMIFFGRMGCVTSHNLLDFGADLDKDVDRGII